MHAGLWWKHLKGKGRLEDLGSIDMRLNKMDFTEIGREVMNCTDLAQNSNK
jgi:hypothetical protein